MSKAKTKTLRIMKLRLPSWFVLILALLLLGFVNFPGQSTLAQQLRNSSMKMRGSHRRQRNRINLKSGQIAPDFRLNTSDGKKSFRLSSYKNKKPVVLIFGSYT